MKKIQYPEWSKPRLPPPKYMHEGFFSCRETEESKRARHEWEDHESRRKAVWSVIDAINEQIDDA